MEVMVIEEHLSKFKGKKVLITGHTGFKGSWLSLWLHLLGADIVGVALEPKTELDNFVVSKVGSILKDYRTDIRNFKALEKIIESEQPEIVFHLAAQPLVLESYRTPLETFEVNTQGTANILEIVRMCKSIKTVVFITTDKVYENKEWVWPYREDERLGGYDPYSASKGAAELIIASYRNSFFNPKNFKDHGKSVASVRAGNVIGGGDWADFRIIPDCVRAIEKNIEIELRSPKSVRPWQHVLEPLGGYLLLASKMMEDPISYAQAWNFGPESENIVEVGVLVDKFIKDFEHGSWKDISGNVKMHEANLLALDIHKAKAQLKWKPVLNFDQTVSFTTEWYKNYKVTDPQQICLKQIDNYMQLWKLKNVN
jgi:CDP-glucose 4,6-dehydratase